MTHATFRSDRESAANEQRAAFSRVFPIGQDGRARMREHGSLAHGVAAERINDTSIDGSMGEREVAHNRAFYHRAHKFPTWPAA